MNLKVAFLVVASTLSLVEPCLYSESFSAQELCKKLWEESFCYPSESSSLLECLYIIKANCPGFLTFETTITKNYEENSPRYETWETRLTAKLTDNPSENLVYLKCKRYYLCWDEHGELTECGHWWRMARLENVDDKHKETCTRKILRHCLSILELVGEEKVCTGGSCPGHNNKTSVTYKDSSGNTVTFMRDEEGILWSEGLIYKFIV